MYMCFWDRCMVQWSGHSIGWLLIVHTLKVVFCGVCRSLFTISTRMRLASCDISSENRVCYFICFLCFLISHPMIDCFLVSHIVCPAFYARRIKSLGKRLALLQNMRITWNWYSLRVRTMSLTTLKARNPFSARCPLPYLYHTV
jgi:hypothetical protein